MAYEFIEYEKRDHIAHITINRPEVFNALHPPANWELAGIWDDFLADPDIWVAIISGAGEKAFCSGNDLKFTAEHPEMFSGHGVFPPSGFGGITNRTDCWKPIIAAVNGFAMGGGFEIALACDIIVAADHAKFGLPEPRVGLIAGGGGVHRLPRQVPLKVAMGMMLTGRHISAPEAYRIGIVNEVVPLSSLQQTVQSWAEDIAACAPLSVQMTKRSAMKGLGLPLETAMERAVYESMEVIGSEDALEGPRAFAEKRKPRWKGR